MRTDADALLLQEEFARRRAVARVKGVPMGDVSGPQRSMLDAFDLISLVSNGPGELFAAARERAASYSEPGDLVAGVASVAAMVLDVLASVSGQTSAELLEQIHHQLGDVLLERNGDQQD